MKRISRIKQKKFAKNCRLIIISAIVSAFLISAAGALSKPFEKIMSVIPKTDKTVLCLGRDRVGYNTDVIILVRINGTNGNISAMQIPRDTHILYRDMPIKVNSLYGRLIAGDKRPSDALLELTEIFSESIGIKIDGAVMIGLDCFVKAVDMIGGVSVNIPFDMKYTDEKQGLYINLKAGEQILDGNMAEQLVRCRSIYVRADIGRIDVQKLFISSLAEKVKNDLSVGELVSLAEEIIKNAETTLDISEIPTLAASVYELSPADSVIFTAPGEVTRGGDFYVLNSGGMEARLSEYFIKESKFDNKKIWRGFFNEEIRALYESEYELKPIDSLKDIAENGVNPSLNE